MFILYAVIVGLVVGVLTGGRLAGLSALRIRWSPVIMAGLLVQIVLFSDAVAAGVGDLGPLVYVASTGLVLVAVLRNVGIPGMAVVVAGATCNLAAILANGGYMPAGRDALAALSKGPATAYSNSAVMPNPALAPLTDIFALPSWLPFANIFSIGDTLIGVGVAIVIVVAMRRPIARADAPSLSGSIPGSASPGMPGASTH